MKIFVDINLIKNEIVPLFKALANDDQDSVRLLTVGACVEIAKILSNEDIQEHVRFFEYRQMPSRDTYLSLQLFLDGWKYNIIEIGMSHQMPISITLCLII